MDVINIWDVPTTARAGGQERRGLLEEMTEEERLSLEQLQQEKTRNWKIFLNKHAVLIADKANNTYVVHCKRHLAAQVVKETTTTKTYEIIQDDTNAGTIAKYKTWMEQEGLAEEQYRDNGHS